MSLKVPVAVGEAQFEALTLDAGVQPFVVHGNLRFQHLVCVSARYHLMQVVSVALALEAVRYRFEEVRESHAHVVGLIQAVRAKAGLEHRQMRKGVPLLRPHPQ